MIDPPYGKPWLLFGLLGCSLALNLVMVLDRDGASDEASAAAPASAEAALPVAESTPGSAAATAAATAPVAPRNLGAAEWSVASAKVSSTLSGALRTAVGDDGTALSAVYSRLFVWDMDLRRDLRRGDRVEVAWQRAPDDTIEVLAARLHSSKLGRTVAAYRWQAPGDAFTSYWQEDGTEVPFRLQNPPLRDYQQITSLLKDRPSHKGMDFKAPVGTLVSSPFAGTVTRTNWNWKYNGNCIEVKYDNGASARFLHLSENRVEPNARVAAGDVIGLVGNTGRSTAPHLHYELSVDGKIVDPLDFHGTIRRRVEGDSMTALHKEIARQDAVLGQGLASR